MRSTRRYRDGSRGPRRRWRGFGTTRRAIRGARAASTSVRKRSGDEEVDAVVADRLLDLGPVFLVVGVDGVGGEAHTLGGGDLVAHERQKRADQEAGPRPASRSSLAAMK